jgi:hypothetical protein
MKLTFGRAAFAAVVALGVMTAWPVSSWANGGGFFSDDEDATADLGPAFFGFVKDSKGKFMPDVEITATIKSQNSTYVLHTDITGHYRIPGFSKAIDPKDIEITASKAGYKLVNNVRRGDNKPDQPIETDFTIGQE